MLDRSNEGMLAYAHSKGLGTVAMGPVGGGRLSAPTELYSKLTGHANWMFKEYVEKGGKLSDSCKNCGMCENKCPQHLKIREELKKVEAIFKK